MAKHDNTDFLRFGDKYLVVDHIVRWESRAHPSGNYVIIGTVGGFESELKDTNGTVLKALVEEFTYPNEPTTMSYYDESGTIDRSAF